MRRVRRPALVAAIGSPCPYCGEPMTGPHRWPSRDHIRPRSKRYQLTADNRAIVCQPCNEAKGSLSLQRFANRLTIAGDPRAFHVTALLQVRLLPSTVRTCDKTLGR